jgi:DNA polymerase-1
MSGQNPNMQNLPKRTEVGKDANMKLRSVFVPEPGTEFMIADFESIEMMILAYYLGDKNYRKMIAEGDPHSVTAAAAAQVIGLPSSRPEDYLKGTPNRWFRDIAKQATYAIVYGGGGRVIAETINKYVMDADHPEYMVTEDQARAIRRAIAGAIPGFKGLTDTPWRGKSYPQGRLYQQLQKSLVEMPNGHRYGFVRTLMGRKQWIQMWPDERAYVALSGLIQGSAADIMKAAAVNVAEVMKPYGGIPILFVHDELVVQVPLGWGERLKPLLIEAMTGAADIDPALSVEANVTARSYAHTD